MGVENLGEVESRSHFRAELIPGSVQGSSLG